MTLDAITIARCTPGRRATKLIRATPDGGFEIKGYDCGWLFIFEQRPVAGLDLAGVLDDVSSDPRRFVLRGEPLAGEGWRRRLLCPDRAHRVRRMFLGEFPGVVPPGPTAWPVFVIVKQITPGTRMRSAFRARGHRAATKTALRTSGSGSPPSRLSASRSTSPRSC